MIYTHVIAGAPGSGHDGVAKQLIEYLSELCPGTGKHENERVEVIRWGVLKKWSPETVEIMSPAKMLRRVSTIKFENPDVEHIVVTGPYAICHWEKFHLFGKSTSIYYVRRSREIEAIELTENFYDKKLKNEIGLDQRSGFLSWARELHEEFDHAVSNLTEMWVPFSEFVTGPHGHVIVVPPVVSEAAAKQILVRKL